MNTILSFEKINQKYRQYQVQGVLIYKPDFFISKKELAVFSVIIEDFDKIKIECVVFGDAASKLSKIRLQINGIYLVTHARAIANKKYIKTKHPFKLQLTENTKIITLKTREYVVNETIYVSVEKRNKKRKL